MSRYPGETPPDCQDRPAESALTHTLTAAPHDVGGFEVRRILPAAKRRMVGPFIFFDHIGPAAFAPGQGIDVRPHPHIGLATLTWLFEGGLRHRDSLGSDLVIRPGALNWMTAGRGIVHSERTDEGDRAAGHAIHGIQSWVALPDDAQDADPGFDHYPPGDLPKIQSGGSAMTLIAGSAFGQTSPARTYSPLFYLAADLAPSARLTLPAELGERAVYVAEGAARVGGEAVPAHSMAVLADGAEPEIEAPYGARLMLLGGAPVGRRTVWWNLVAPDRAAIEAAKADWTAAAQAGFPAGGRFPLPPGEEEFIPLPEG